MTRVDSLVRNGHLEIECLLPWESLHFSSSDNFFTVETKHSNNAANTFTLTKCEIVIEQMPDQEFEVMMEP